MALKDWKREPKIVEANATFSRWHKDGGNKLFSVVSFKKWRIYEAHPSVWKRDKDKLGYYHAGQSKKFHSYSEALAHAKAFMRRN